MFDRLRRLSKDGTTHNEAEHIELDYPLPGVNALLSAVFQRASQYARSPQLDDLKRLIGLRKLFAQRTDEATVVWLFNGALRDDRHVHG